MKDTSVAGHVANHRQHQPAPPVGMWGQQGGGDQTLTGWGQPVQQQPPGGWDTTFANRPAQQQPSGSAEAQHLTPPSDPGDTTAEQSQRPATNPWGNRGMSPPELPEDYLPTTYSRIPDATGSPDDRAIFRIRHEVPSRTAPGGSQLSSENGAMFSKNIAPHEYLQFTAFYSRVVPTITWNTLLVYAHLEAALQAIRGDAQKFQEEIGTRSGETSTWAALPLMRGTPITIVPACQGIRFNPERLTFAWVEDWHQIKFRFQADPRLAGAIGNGEITMYAGPLIIGTSKISMRFVQQDLAPHSEERKNFAETSTYLYKRIFASYSHQDTPVVLACRNVYKALGFENLIDMDTLRSGQHWNSELMGLIDNADLFQLFWSPGAAQSAYVRQEWQYALQRSRREDFIRPVYWQQPLVSPPVELKHLHFAYIELPRLDTSDETQKLLPQAIRIASVRIERGKEAGRSYEIRKDTFRIGRSRDSDVFLEDLAVSRLHASILKTDDGTYALRDEGGANGTKLNGQRLNKYQLLPLTEGDQIQTGETVLVFLKRNVS